MSQNIKNKFHDSNTFISLKSCLNKLIAMNVLIIPELLDKSKDLEKQLMDEMSEMDRAINDAALRIEVCPHPLCFKTLF